MLILTPIKASLRLKLNPVLVSLSPSTLRTVLSYNVLDFIKSVV